MATLEADTTGAKYGRIAGAWYGVESIPESWRFKLAKNELLEEIAGSLYEVTLK